MKRLLPLVLTAVFFLSGCSVDGGLSAEVPKDVFTEETEAFTEFEEQTETSETTVCETIVETEEPEKSVDVVSSLAKEDFLIPFEKYSWEREFDIEYVVIHFTSNVVNSKEAPYDIDKVKEIFETTEVSTNYIIDRDGSIKCYIPENYAAWHAGKGTFADDEKYTNKMNKYSVGIELLAIGSANDMKTYLSAYEYGLLDKEFIGFTDEQYVSLKELLKDICQRNSIPYDRQHIIGHDEYNPQKSDPGELFVWDRLFE